MLIVIAVLAYLTIGTLYARQRTVQHRPVGPRPEFAVLDLANHGKNCDLRDRFRSDNGCDCEEFSSWVAARRTVKAWESRQADPSVAEVYNRLLLWPLMIHHALMRPPASKESRRERRMRHELENARHIAEITRITASNQQSITEALNPLEVEERERYG